MMEKETAKYSNKALTRENALAERKSDSHIHVKSLSEFNQLMEQLPVEDSGMVKFRLETAQVSGFLGICILDGLALLRFEWNTHENFQYNFPNSILLPIKFLFIKKGSFQIISESGKKSIPEIRPCILKERKEGFTKVHLRAKSLYQFSIIGFRNSRSSGNSYSELHRYITSKLSGSKAFKNEQFYLANYNLQILDLYNHIFNCEAKNSMQKVYTQAKCKEVLIGICLQIIEDLDTTHNLLSPREKMATLKAAEIITNNLSKNITVNELASEVFMNVAQLQRCFKILFNKTVNNYALDYKFSVLQMMLRERKRSISQIVFDLGYSSKSYFSKIFKEKYQVTPSTYRHKILKGTFYD